MLRSAIAVGPELARAGERGVGDTVLAVVQASRRAARANTNLGIALLLAPLAKAALDGGPLRERLAATLGALDVADARAAYAAIRVAGAGGLDERVEHDVRSEPAVGLREAMASAAARDSIAAEYVSDFALTFETGLPALGRGAGRWARRARRDRRVAPAAARRDAGHADRAQARRRGRGARVGGARATCWLPAACAARPGGAPCAASTPRCAGPGNALNPGTTADLVTATLFVALLEGIL